MTALTADRNTKVKQGALFAQQMAAATVIYNGAMVNVDANGYAVAATDTADHKFIGVSDQTIDNSTGANGALIVQGKREGVMNFASSLLTRSQIGDPVYVVDDQSVSAAIVAQPTNVTGVVLERLPMSRGGSYNLAFTLVGTTLAFGGGTPVDVSAGGEFVLSTANGTKILAKVDQSTLPTADQSDTIALRHVQCGTLESIDTDGSVWVAI